MELCYISKINCTHEQSQQSSAKRNQPMRNHSPDPSANHAISALLQATIQAQLIINQTQPPRANISYQHLTNQLSITPTSQQTMQSQHYSKQQFRPN
ncbi:hypothetical protein Nepgr_020401 [Nepenthes gracilis]|uniref:Uncharacterized protein n=1 Tax=Nepenthes gracilis TaxID=150966 RepID=A0AAD3SV91_NEPGR|nr:hypothetical protein Nepgr_020401 [Nepenthes gracilis]